MIIVEIVLCVGVLLFSAAGMAALMRFLAGRVFRSEQSKIISVIPLRGEDTEMLLRAAAALSGTVGCGGRYYAVDCGLSSAQIAVAQRFCRENSGFTFISSGDFCKEILNGADTLRTD